MLKELPAEPPSPSPSSPAGRPAELLALGLAAARPWRPEELAAAWEYHLSAPLQFDLGGLEPARARELRDLSAAQGLLLASLRGLLQHPVPPLEPLEMVKDFAKACLRAPDPPLPRELAGALYHLALAVALTRLGERITNLADAEILHGLDWAMARPWLDKATRATLALARRVVAESGPAQDARHG